MMKKFYLHFSRLEHKHTVFDDCRTLYLINLEYTSTVLMKLESYI